MDRIVGHSEFTGKIIEINRRSVFSLDEAREVLPVVYRITKTYFQKVEVLINRLDAMNKENEAAVTALETQINDLIQEWQNKVGRLGALPKGLWIADFDSGDGYFCWKYPERSIDFWHKYTDGYSKRISVRDRVQTFDLTSRLSGQQLGQKQGIDLQPNELSE